MSFTAEDLRANLDDPLWRLSNLYRIITKGQEGDDDLVVTFKPNRAQRRLLQRLWNRNLILKARQLGFCVAPDTRVLTADLRWARIDSLNEGDKLVAVDEHPPGGRGKSRRMRTATVQATATVHRLAYRITFDDGRQVVCTDRHPWLSKKAGDSAEWRSISGRGNSVVGRLKIGTHVRWIAKPWADPTVEDGWFGGMLDGEGSISNGNTSAGINVSQRAGPVWDRLVKYCDDRGYSHCIESDKAERPSKYGKIPVPKISFGRMDEMFRVIGQTRPTRFIGNWFWEGRELPGKRNGGIGWATITGIEELGEQPMIDLQTSTGTYIAEGFVSHNTTLICMLWLDSALFSKDPLRCGIIAQDREAAEAIFSTKIKFAYDNLPEALRAMFPTRKCTTSEIEFGHNGSSIRVATSMRSGTIHRLLISEYGKICSKYPDKAKEVQTGSIPAVPLSGILVIESTAEGQEGDFYAKSETARKLSESKAELTPKDYRFHFFAWWEAPEYVLPAGSVPISPVYLTYFAKVEGRIGRQLTEEQRAWYVATCESDFSGDQSLMWQEYPSYPEEAFQVSTEGCYYAEQLSRARTSGRIMRGLPVLPVPVNTFWDLGRGDMSTVWLHQRHQLQDRFIGYYENSGEDISHYAAWLQRTAQERNLVFGTHYLPHEADYKRLGKTPDTNQTLKEMFEELMPGHRFAIVPRVSNLSAGIQATRAAFSSAWFDEEHCAQGLKRVGNYRKRWNKTLGCWSEEEQSDDNAHGADALRQWGQEVAAGNSFAAGSVTSKGFKRRGSPMAV